MPTRRIAGKGKAMNPLYRIALIAATLHLLTCGANGQAGTGAGTGTVSVSVQSAGNQRATVMMRMPAPPHGPVVSGAPYSAEEVFDHTQTLADGTHITQKTRVSKVFRDSQGRSRRERHLFSGANGDDLTIVEIADPVSGFGYILDPYNHVAHRFAPAEGGGGQARYAEHTPVVPAPTEHVVTSAPPPTDRPEVSTESLGSQIIEGVNAEGKKTTRTIPIGMMGNDRPLVNVTEFWFSPELRITVLTKNSDPRMGESVMQLRNIERSEPDPALFSVPPDYQVVDENGEAEIKIVRP